MITTGKKNDTVVCLASCAVVSEKIQSSVWQVVLLCQFLVLAGNWQFFVVAGNFYYDRKKNDTVVCLAGGRSLLRPEKKF